MFWMFIMLIGYILLMITPILLLGGKYSVQTAIWVASLALIGGLLMPLIEKVTDKYDPFGWNEAKRRQKEEDRRRGRH